MRDPWSCDKDNTLFEFIIEFHNFIINPNVRIEICQPGSFFLLHCRSLHTYRYSQNERSKGRFTREQSLLLFDGSLVFRQPTSGKIVLHPMPPAPVLSFLVSWWNNHHGGWYRYTSSCSAVFPLPNCPLLFAKVPKGELFPPQVNVQKYTNSEINIIIDIGICIMERQVPSLRIGLIHCGSRLPVDGYDRSGKTDLSPCATGIL